MRISKTAKQTYAEIKRIAKFDADRGGEFDNSVRLMLHNKVIFTKEREYMNLKKVDIPGAKKLYEAENKLYDILYEEENKDEPDAEIIKQIENQLKKFEIENLMK